MADKKGVPVGQVAAAVAAMRAPELQGTTPEAVKFHDDRSLYTGEMASWPEKTRRLVLGLKQECLRSCSAVLCHAQSCTVCFPVGSCALSRAPLQSPETQACTAAA